MPNEQNQSQNHDPNNNQAKPAEKPSNGEEEARPLIATSALSEAIVSLQDSYTKQKDHLLRVAAEFDNYRKRTKKEITDGTRLAETRLVLEFLPIIDNLERALEHAGEANDGLVSGVQMVHKQFLTTLEKFDIKPFVSVGSPFDPEYHEAVQQIPSEKPVNTVCNELLKGYMRGEHLVRPAMVVVSKGPAESMEAPSKKEEPVATSNAEEK